MVETLIQIGIQHSVKKSYNILSKYQNKSINLKYYKNSDEFLILTTVCVIYWQIAHRMILLDEIDFNSPEQTMLLPRILHDRHLTPEQNRIGMSISLSNRK